MTKEIANRFQHLIFITKIKKPTDLRELRWAFSFTFAVVEHHGAGRQVTNLLHVPHVLHSFAFTQGLQRAGNKAM